MRPLFISLAAMILIAGFFLQPASGRHCATCQGQNQTCRPAEFPCATPVVVPPVPKAAWPWTPPKPVPPHPWCPLHVWFPRVPITREREAGYAILSERPPD